MATLASIIGFFSILAFAVGIVWLVVALVKHRDMKKPGALSVAAFGVFILAIVITPSRDSGLSSNPDATPTPTPTFEQAKLATSTVSYDDLFRHNEQHVGKKVYFEGKITQIQKLGGDSYLFRINVTNKDFYFEDDVRVDYSGPRFLENDTVVFVGTVKGLWSYKTVLGAQRTIPHITDARVELVAKAP